MIRSTIAALLFTASATASMFEGMPATAPVSTLVASRGARVVASETGMYLAGAQRVTANGVLIDDEPLTGLDGHAAPWRDGWMVVRSIGGRLHLMRLRASGPPESTMVLPGAAQTLVGTAASGGRLAILEIDHYPGSELRLTIAEEHRVVSRRTLGEGALNAVVTAVDGGFLVAWWRRDETSFAHLSAIRLDLEGEPVRFRHIDSLPGLSPYQLALATSETRILILYTIHPRARYRVFDLTLEPHGRGMIDLSGGTLSWGTPLAIADGFLVPYKLKGEHFARIVRPDGTADPELPSEPIAGGDRSGNRYLVVRPWGEAAIAEEDPRSIITPPVQLRTRVYQTWRQLRSTVSDDVTLLRFGHYYSTDAFVRVDGSGDPVDLEPQALPATIAERVQVIAIPAGFAFAWFQDGEVRYQRLSRRGGWLDDDPIVLATDSRAWGFAAHANAHDLLLAWSNDGELLWRRLTHGGAPIDIVPRTIPLVSSPTYNRWGVAIAGNGGGRLLSLLEVHPCVITCEPAEPRPFIVETVTIDDQAVPTGLPQPTNSEGFAAIGLTDGTWVIPARPRNYHEPPEILHLARNGSLISRRPSPELSGDLIDAGATPSGWTAILGWPGRVVEFHGAATPERLTGFQSARGFAAGNKLAFLAGSPIDEAVIVPWTGRSSATEGDLAVSLQDGGIVEGSRRVIVAVRNNGQGDASGAVVHRIGVGDSTGEPFEVPSLRPGEAYHFTARVAEPNEAWPVLVVSDSVSDVNPADNSAKFADAVQPSPRSRPVRP